MSTEEKGWEDNGWVIGGIILAVFLIGTGMTYSLHKSGEESQAKYDQYEKERLARPIIDLRNGFVEVQYMNCLDATKGYSKKQLSKLTQEEKFLVQGAVECAVTYQHLRIRKDRIRAYTPHFSIFLWRDDKDSDDPGGPLHVKEVNIENCEIAIGGTVGEAKWQIIAGACSLLDRVL